MGTMSRWLASLALVTFGALVTGCPDESEPCTVGAEGCSCTAGGGCDPGLSCLSNLCVAPGGSDATNDGVSSDSSGTVDAAPDTARDGTADGDAAAPDQGPSVDAATDTPAGSDATTADVTIDAPVAGDATSDATADTAAPPNCGDSNVDLDQGEQCDDGNTTDGDGCDSDCQVEVGVACGNNTLEPANGEECDDGNTTAGDGCGPNCQLEPVGATCGDNTVDNLEVCDDDNTTNGDACNPTCNLENTTTLFVGAPGVPGLVDGTGQNARLGGWCVMAADNTYLWVGDTLNNGHSVVRRVDIQTGDMLTVAGGQQGNQDDATGVNARFQWIEAITTDGSTVWVADGGNRTIRAIDLQAPYAVTTVAGSGQAGVTDGVGTAATFEDLRGLTYYAGKLYSLDGTNAVLRSFDPITGDVVTLAGTVGQTGQADGIGAAATFISPRYMTSDNSGMLFIADTNGSKLRSYNVTTGFVGTFAGDGNQGYLDGVGAAAQIHRPRGLTSDGTSIYIAEFNQHTIRQGVIATGEISTNVGQDCGGGANCAGGYQEGTGTANTQLSNPVGLAFHFASNTLFICDSGNNVIRALK